MNGNILKAVTTIKIKTVQRIHQPTDDSINFMALIMRDNADPILKEENEENDRRRVHAH